jgi:hypothetical protein
MINVLLQTTIEHDDNDWSIERFSKLMEFLATVRDERGHPMFNVTARDRARLGDPDPVLSTLHDSDFDELWLFAVDTGDGLTTYDCLGISKFRQRGGGLLLTRDHMDLGSSLCTLGGVAAAHHFHSSNKDPDVSRHRIDDPFTTDILWPNYHSGANGDFQRVRAVGDAHPVLRDPHAAGGLVEFLPSHPHEGGVSAPPEDPSARVILQGNSAATGVAFNLAVAFESAAHGGRAIAQSTFHHFCDYNWDIDSGAPSFVGEAPGDGMKRNPDALRSTKQYVLNVASWLAGGQPM